MTIKALMLAAVAAMVVPGAASAQSTVYANTFMTDTNGFVGGTYETAPLGEKYLALGNANGGGSPVSTLTFDATGYAGLTLTFNLYGIQSVDGNGPQGGGADPFLTAFNGNQIININLANYSSGNTQNFNGNLAASGPGHFYDPRTGAIASGTLGYGDGAFGDSTYLISLTLEGALSGVNTLTFSGLTNEEFGNERYGIDNVSITGTAVTDAPEPATWAMMIGGFALAAIGLRGRRRRSVLIPATA